VDAGEGGADSAQTKKVKTEHLSEDNGPEMTQRSASASSIGGERARAAPTASQPVRSNSGDSPVISSSASLSNLDRLANLAAQRSDSGVQSPLLNTPTSSSTLPLSLQRLQAMRNAQAQSTSTPQSYDQLVDVMGYSGVDLRAEEAFIQQSGSFYDDAQTAATIGTSGLSHGLYLNVYPLSSIVNRIAKQYGLKVDAATLDYLSIATRIRFRNLLESMVRASRHRAWSSHQRKPPMHAGFAPDGSRVPMYHEELLSNPTKQLAAIEKAERIEEGNWRRMRLEREEAEAAALEAAGGTGDDGTPGKKAKRPMTSSRNLSEDVRKRLADSTAMRHLGANSVTSKYAWLQSPGMRTTPRAPRESATATDADESPAPASRTATGSALPKPKFAPSAGVRNPAMQAAHAGAWSDVATRQAAQREQERVAKARITLHDALSALEREQACGAGHGAGRRALYLAQAYGHGRGSL